MADELDNKKSGGSEVMERCLAQIEAFLFEYQTPRLVTMRTKRIGILYRLVQTALLVYLIGYVLVYTKSYQKFDNADSSVLTRIKGVLKRNVSGTEEVWDNVDFVVPAQESNGFFIATNLLYTYNQSQGTCPEDRHVGKNGILCFKDSDCPADMPTEYGNGIRTGRCSNTTGTCEVFGWCPTEIDIAPSQPVLKGFDSVTVLVKNHIAFPKFNLKRRNLLDSFTEEYLKVCRFHPVDNPICPVFSIRDIVTYANEDFDKMAVKIALYANDLVPQKFMTPFQTDVGGVIGFHIDWDCDLDKGPEKCLPQYSFQRLDNEQDKVAKGWSFRHAYYNYDAHGTFRRDLVKYWGIRFVFLVNGHAGAFSTVHFVLHLGSSIGLFGVASFICEMALGQCHHSEVLQEQKFVSLEIVKATKRRRCKKAAKADSGQTMSIHLGVQELIDQETQKISTPDNI